MKTTRFLLLISAFFACQTIYGQYIWSVSNSTSGTGCTNYGACPVFDVNCNMYFFDKHQNYIKKMDAATGIITNIAGNGTAGNSGDGFAATAAEIGAPIYLAIDGNNNLYFSDDAYYVVRKIEASSGNIFTIAGVSGMAGYYGEGVPATTAYFDGGPLGIAVDDAGNVYLADANNDRIRVVNTSGVISTFAGGSSSGFSGDGGPATNAKFFVPCGIKFNADKSIMYVSDYGNARVRTIEMTGSNVINTVAGNGTFGYSGDGGPATSAALYGIYDVALDNSNNLFIVNNNSSVIRGVDATTHDITTVVGDGTTGNTGDSGPATSAEIDPQFINTDAVGNLYVSTGYAHDYPIRYVCAPSTSAFTISSSPAGPGICSGSSVTFTANTVSGSGCLNFQWYKFMGSTPVLVGSGPTYTDHSPNYPTEEVYCTAIPWYNEIHANCGGGSVESNHIILDVSQTPQITDADINTRCLPGVYGSTAPDAQITMGVTGGAGTITYTWTPGIGNNVALASSTDYTISNPTIGGLINVYGSLLFNYDFTVVDDYGCTASKNITTHLITSGWDLATKDGHFDLYDEPSQSTIAAGETNIWSSPDIWNRWYDDRIATQVDQGASWWPPCSGCTVGHTNYIYTRVRNVGCIASPDAADGCLDAPLLHRYWTLGGSLGTEFWPAAWTTATTGGYPEGLEIGGSASIPSIDPGDNTIIGQAWNPPSPHHYTGADEIEFCFLARVVDDHNQSSCGVNATTDGMTFQEANASTVNPSQNVRKNNNIVTRNSSDMWVPAPPGPPHHRHLLFVGNPGDIGSVPVSFQMGNNFTLNPGTSVSVLPDFISFKVYLGDVFDLWQAAGGHGTYDVVNFNEKSVTFDGRTTIMLDSIVLDSGAQYPIFIEPRMLPGVDGSSMPEEVIVFRGFTDDTGLAIGSYSFTVKYDSRPIPNGVLAITELSQGPTAGCQYVEMIVANCGGNGADYVNVQGWVIDDNTGILDSGVCDTAHYRLAYDSVWAMVPVGSRIVMYNHTTNCYNLPDTLTVDDTNHIYWVPIGYNPTAPNKYAHVERYIGRENANSCSYCSDTGKTVYDTTGQWMNTIALNDNVDGIQIRCPGCTSAKPAAPGFYQGVGYQPIDTSLPETAFGTNDIGMVLQHPSGTNFKYVFTGTEGIDLLNPVMWTRVTADTAGVCPPTLGYVDSAFYFAAYTHTLGLPCCGDGLGLRGMQTTTNPVPTRLPATSIRVYPNPANETIYFEFPLSGDATIKLMDVTGRVVSEQHLQNRSAAAIDVKGLVPGIYIYHVVANNLPGGQAGKVLSGKIVIQ